jgi:hypothetical protein
MGFLNPWMLLGTVGVSVPIIIHLLNRFRHRRVDWGAMELLRRAMMVRSRQVQIEDLILLVLRCLAVGLVAFAMARPTIKASASIFGQSGKTQAGVVIALDSSFSMGHKPGLSSRFDVAKQKTREILRTLDAGAPVTLMTMGTGPTLPFHNTGYDEERFDQKLSQMSPLPDKLNLEPCLEQATSAMGELVTPNRECYIITDAQTISWERLSDKSKYLIKNMSREGKVFFLPVGTDNCENLTVARLELASGAVRKGATARYLVEVRNNGKIAQHGVSVGLFLNDSAIDQRLIDQIEPGKSVSVPLFARFDKVGTNRLSARLRAGADALAADNVREMAVNVRPSVRVLCVDGRPSDKPFKGAAGYIVAALNPLKSTADQGMQVKAISWMELPIVRLADYDVVIMSDVADVKQEQAAALYRYVQGGGGLVFFMGNNVNANIYNSRFHFEGSAGAGSPKESLLPCELGDVAKLDAADKTGGWTMEPMSQSPMANLVRMLPKELMDEARFGQYLKMKLLPGATAILNIATTNDPLLVERAVGQGKVLLFASSGDRSWTNFPIHPAGPMLLHQAVTYLMMRPYDLPLTVGEPLSLTLPRQDSIASITFHQPNGTNKPIQLTSREGASVAEFGTADQTGFYEAVVPAVGAAPATTITFAVNVDPSEGDVRCLQEPELSKALAGVPVGMLSVDQDLGEQIRQGRVGKELWRYLMLFALAVLVVESFLARRFSRRMAVKEMSTTRAAMRDELLAETAA